MERKIAQKDEHRRGDVERSVDQAAAIAPPAFAKAEGEVQEERRLKRCSLHVGPVDDEIESIECACELEGVEDERHQAEDIKVGRLRRCPASEENVKSDGQIDETYEPLDLVVGTVGGLKDDANVDGDGLGPIGGLTEDGVSGVTPDPGLIHLIGGGGDHRGWDAIDGGENVALANAGLFCSGA